MHEMNWPQVTQVQLIRVLESAATVRHRGDFFMWAQGHLQALLPHGVMVGLLLNEQGTLMHSECLQSVPVDAGLLEQLQNPANGLLIEIGRLCQSSGKTQLNLPVNEVQHAAAGSELRALDEVWKLTQLGPAQFVASGDMGLGQFALFAFLLRPEPASALQQHVLQLLLPQLMMLLWRTRLFAQNAVPASPSEVGQALTERQMEILHWVKLGKTNFEIAHIVGISELTVKNHLQKVFKRLNVHNRAQAVAQLMAVNPK